MGGMTYLYHADVFNFPPQNYSKLTKPFLVVAGTLDSIITESDVFVEKAKKTNCPITFFWIEGMHHFIRNRPEIIMQSFAWLKNLIQSADL